jgi:hypothetical protein
LVAEISYLFTGSDLVSHIYALDEGSSAAFDLNSIALPVNTCVVAIGVIRLAVNLGHQGAIAA